MLDLIKFENKFNKFQYKSNKSGPGPPVGAMDPRAIDTWRRPASCPSGDMGRNGVGTSCARAAHCTASSWGCSRVGGTTGLTGAGAGPGGAAAPKQVAGPSPAGGTFGARGGGGLVCLAGTGKGGRGGPVGRPSAWSLGGAGLDWGSSPAAGCRRMAGGASLAMGGADTKVGSPRPLKCGGGLLYLPLAGGAA